MEKKENTQISMDMQLAHLPQSDRMAVLNQDAYVYQANYLIENRPQMSKDELRLYITILSLISRNADSFGQILRIPVSEFSTIWGIQRDSSYSQIKEALSGLQKKLFFSVETITDGKKEFLQVPFISLAHYRQGEGFCTVRIEDIFKPYLVNLSREYTRYMLRNISRLSESLSMRVYELAKQYEAIGTRYFLATELRRILCLDGKYNLNADLIKAITKAVKSINEKTDLIVHIEVIGKGKIMGMEFKISPKEKLRRDKEESEETFAARKLEEKNYDTEADKEAPIEFIKWVKEKPLYKKASCKSSYLTSCLSNEETILEFIKERIETIRKRTAREQSIQEAEDLDRQMKEEMQEKARQKRESGEMQSIADILKMNMS